jgi:hypothetical protein
MTALDLDWLIEAARARREALAPHAPHFWNPAVDATDKHRTFLAGLVEDPSVLTVRVSDGYLIAAEQGATWLVDDADVTGDGEWLVEGVQLLRYAQDRHGPLRFVVPTFESSRMDAARAVGLRPVEYWWHRDLGTASRAGTKNDPSLLVDGAAGLLVEAPPVYDPGGPVLFVTEVDDVGSLRRIEARGTALGAPVSVVRQAADDARLTRVLIEAGYALTTAFCEGAGPVG